MKFKVGSLIRTKEGDIVDCEGIIVKYWPGKVGEKKHNVTLFITFDRLFPEDVNRLQDYRGFKPSRWELKK